MGNYEAEKGEKKKRVRHYEVIAVTKSAGRATWEYAAV